MFEKLRNLKENKIFYAICAAGFAVLVLVAVVLTIICGKNNEQEVFLPSEAEKTADEPFCVLLLGRDRTSDLSDVIILASFDIEQGRATLMQIPRDTYAKYTEKSYKKLNAAPHTLGESGFCSLLSDAFGVKIDGYLSFDLDAFALAVDTLGGVEMTLDEPLKYRDPEQGLYIDLPAGKQRLDGKSAEMLVRYRSGYLRGDLDRLDMQKRFMAALFNTLKSSLTAQNVYSIVPNLLPHIKTDISAGELAVLALKATELEATDLSFLTLPGEEARAASGASYFVISRPSAEKVLKSYFCAEGVIDEEKLFLNTQNESFRKIYESEKEIKIFNVSNLE